MIEEFINLIKNNDECNNLYRGYVNNAYDEKDDPVEIGDFIIKTEEQYGGEGQGDIYFVVLSLEKNGQKKYIKLDGWYASYAGHEFNDIYNPYEVKQVEKVIKVWE